MRRLLIVLGIQLASVAFMALFDYGVLPVQDWIERWPGATFTVACLWFLLPPPLAIVTAACLPMNRIAKALLISFEVVWLSLLLAGLAANVARLR